MAWQVHEDLRGRLLVIADDSHRFLISSDPTETCHMCREYARRIAALPDLEAQRNALLVACQEALEYFEEIEWHEGGGKWYEDVTAQLRATIQAADQDSGH